MNVSLYGEPSKFSIDAKVSEPSPIAVPVMSEAWTPVVELLKEAVSVPAPPSMVSLPAPPKSLSAPPSPLTPRPHPCTRYTPGHSLFV